MRALARPVLDAVASLRLSCVLLALLGLLTWLGTLEQVDHGLYEVQKKYFESFVLVHDAGAVSIPLPGANLVLCTLFVNLLAGGIVRLRKSRATAGVLVAHVGIVMLLVSGFVKTYFADEGYVTLYEGERANHFQSHYRWEIALLEPLGEQRWREHVVDQETLERASGTGHVRLSAHELPFTLAVDHFFENCQPLPKGPMFDVDVPVVDGVFLRELALRKEAETNIAGAYVSVRALADDARFDGVVWGAEAAPWTVEVDGRTWAIELRRERRDLPFTLRLEDFSKEDHPRIGMPKSFASDVTITDANGSRPVEISMNEPLRHRGLVVYQASWGPSNALPGQPLFSTFAVARNPADRVPLVGCIVIGIGLMIHFSRKLLLHVRREARNA
jgi:hypothetical protein